MTRNKSEKKIISGGRRPNYRFRHSPPPPPDQYYVASVCAAHPTSGHMPLYNKNGKPMTAIAVSSTINLRSRICIDCGCVYFEIGQDEP